MAGLLIKTAFLPLDAAEVLGNISRHEGGGILPLGGATEVLGGHKVMVTA